MKKYFLIIILLALVFLGLGNYSHAAITCADGSTTCDSISQCDCIEEGTPQVECFACKAGPTPEATAKNSCEIMGGLWMSANGSMGCCDTVCQTCQTKAGSVTRYVGNYRLDCATTGDQAVANSLCSGGLMGDGPKGGTVNSFGICSCPKGTKKIKNVCEPCDKQGVCCGTELNTNIPFIGKCIESDKAYKSPDETSVTGETAFPVLMGSLAKILVTVILIISFVLIIIGGIMISTGDPAGGKKMIIKVVVGIALLGASGVILRLINPNFFG